jgi:AGZA family xanthine/uracil permease-like MFS transporter
VIILILVLTGFRTAVFHAVPPSLKVAISVGIGLFIALIGFVDAGFAGNGESTPLQLGRIGTSLNGWPVVVFCFGLVLVIALWVKKVKGAILISILVSTVLAVIIEAISGQGAAAGPDATPGGWSQNVPKGPGWSNVFSTPHFDTLGHFNLLGSFDKAGVVVTILLIFTLMLADFFDTVGTVTAIGTEAGLLDEEGMPPNVERILVVDSIAAAAGGAAGISSNTSYIESASGVGEGARTGLASVVTGVLFLAAIVVSNLVAVIPSEAAVPALVLVGFLMMQQVGEIDWRDVEVALPAFLTIVLMPFTYSITVGIGAGFLAYVLIKLVKGKTAEVPPLLWLIAALFVVYFAIHPITELLT